jgi:hypothetical protein
MLLGSCEALIIYLGRIYLLPSSPTFWAWWHTALTTLTAADGARLLTLTSWPGWTFFSSLPVLLF